MDKDLSCSKDRRGTGRGRTPPLSCPRPTDRPYQNRTKYQRKYRYSRLLALPNLFILNSRWGRDDRVKMLLHRRVKRPTAPNSNSVYSLRLQVENVQPKLEVSVIKEPLMPGLKYCLTSRITDCGLSLFHLQGFPTPFSKCRTFAKHPIVGCLQSFCAANGTTLQKAVQLTGAAQLLKRTYSRCPPAFIVLSSVAYTIFAILCCASPIRISSESSLEGVDHHGSRPTLRILQLCWLLGFWSNTFGPHVEEGLRQVVRRHNDQGSGDSLAPGNRIFNPLTLS